MKPVTEEYLQNDSIYTILLNKQNLSILIEITFLIAWNEVCWGTDCKGAQLPEVMEMFHTKCSSHCMPVYTCQYSPVI